MNIEEFRASLFVYARLMDIYERSQSRADVFKALAEEMSNSPILQKMSWPWAVLHSSAKENPIIVASEFLYAEVRCQP